MFARWLEASYGDEYYQERSASFMDNFKLPLPEWIITSYLKSKYNAQNNDFKSISLIEGTRSTIRHLYTEREIEMEKRVENKINEFVKGYRRQLATAREEGKAPMTEGKMPLSIQGYRLLCRKSMILGPRSKTAADAHLFTLLQWNLMARSESISSLLYEHLHWESDSLVLQFCRHKGDQEGKSNTIPRHMYANPFDATVCPITALGMHILLHPYRSNGNQRLFEQTEIKRDFGFWLAKTLMELSEQERDVLGNIPKELGTHSIRKGIMTYVHSLPSTANMSSLFLRMGWSLGNVPSRYIFECEGGQDEMIGRLATLLPFDGRLASLPPHFTSLDILTSKEYHEIIPCLDEYPHCFRSCITYLIASLIHHKDKLEKLLTKAHPLFSTNLFTGGYADRVRDKVVTHITHCPDTGMTATGVPPFIATIEAINRIQEELKDLKQCYVSNTEDMRKELPIEVGNHVLSNCRVEGAVGITPDQLERNTAAIMSHFDNRIEEVMNHSSQPQHQVSDDDVSRNSNKDNNRFCWNGKFHKLPKEYRLPRCPVQFIWNLWFRGDTTNQYPPFYTLSENDLKVNADKVALSKARGVISYLLEAVGPPLGNYAVSCRVINRMGYNEQDILFHETFTKSCIDNLKCAPNAKYCQIYKKICEWRNDQH